VAALTDALNHLTADSRQGAQKRGARRRFAHRRAGARRCEARWGRVVPRRALGGISDSNRKAESEPPYRLLKSAGCGATQSWILYSFTRALQLDSRMSDAVSVKAPAPEGRCPRWALSRGKPVRIRSRGLLARTQRLAPCPTRGFCALRCSRDRRLDVLCSIPSTCLRILASPASTCETPSCSTQAHLPRVVCGRLTVAIPPWYETE